MILLAAAASHAKDRPFPTYPHAVRCSGLTGAWVREVKSLSEDGINRFDKALYWGMAAADVARRARVSAVRMEADLEAARAAAQAELAATGATGESARRELAACVAEVPEARPTKR